MNKVILPKYKSIIIFLVFAFGYYISNLLRAIIATISPELVTEFNLSAGELGLLAENQKDNVVPATLDKLEDLGNYKLLTARVGNFVIKSKIKREAEVSSSNISLYMPPERCCVYENERLL